MNTRQNSRRWKKAVEICLACVLVLDVILLYADWRARSAGPEEQIQRRTQLEQLSKLLAADVAKGNLVEKQLPLTQKQCDSFYEQHLLSSATGYSVILPEITQMARSSGVTASDVKFNSSQVKDRNLTQFEISADVQGDYQGLIRFINAIERSNHFYVLDGLTLASETSGGLKLNLSLRTYFRT